MASLINCLNKTSKLINKADADQLVYEARALEARGMSPIAAEQQAVRDAQAAAISNGEDILRQIRVQRPSAYQQATEFWNKETIRKAGEAPPQLPRFVTEARVAGTPIATVSADEIVAVHNAEDSTGSTVNAVHGNLAGRNNYSVSIFPDLGITVPGKNITVEQVNAFAAKVQAAGIDVSGPNLTIGTWWDRETDTTFIDVSFTTTDRAAAIAFGEAFNQKAIFDLKALEEINTGGTGVAPENLPSIAERLGILFPPGYDVGRSVEPTTQKAPAGPPGTAYGPAEEAVPGGAAEVQQELGGVQEEVQVTPPEIPAAPISDAAQEAVNSLPEEQRRAAQKAFAQDDRDPLADQQRKNGEPVKKRIDKAIAPEKNKLVKELSKYGAFDKTLAEVVANIAGDPKQPRWIRLLADLFTQLGLGDNVNIRAVNSPEASWRALYNGKGENGAEVLINLSHAKGPDLARTLLHELMHHGTLIKLDAAYESKLTSGELAAKRELQKIFDIARTRMTGVAARYGARGSLKEFVSEIFSNDALRAQLNATRPDGKVSLLRRFSDAILKLFIGDRDQIGMRSGSLLEAAIKEALNVAGSPRVESDTAAAMQEKRTRAARLANAFPGLEEQIADTIAPMAAEHNMGITKAERKKRVTAHDDPAVAFYTNEERVKLEEMIDKQAPAFNATKEDIAQVKKRLEIYVKDVRGRNPPEAGWAHDEIDPVRVVLLRGKGKGRLLFDITKVFKDAPYTFARDDNGKNFPRFLKQSKVDEAAGKPLIVNPEWEKRRAELGDAMYDEMLQMMSRTDDRRNIILEQVNWYRDMIVHLRTTFGSMSDYMADVIAGFSPQQAVKENWLDMVDYFGGVMSGRYDEIYSEFDKYIREDPENRTATTWNKLGKPMPRKIANDALFAANTANAMMAGLDLWRAVKFNTAPKARNFGLNLIGLSVKATIDRWAARFLQRMHNPNWRIPLASEGEVAGLHMKDVSFVAGDFGMGQDVFADVAKRLQASGTPEFENLTAADLQAILWFAEKEYWETRSWSPIVGAGSSMKAVAEGTSAQRYEAGLKPETSPAKKMAGETAKFRAELHKDKSVIGGKVTPTVSLYKGKQLQTIDADWVTKPDYDPTKSVADLAKAAVSLGRDAAHVSRVILDPNENNPNAMPGLHIFFKGRVSEKEIQPVLDQLKKAGLDGVIFSVDPRVRPEIIKSLDPKVNPNQYAGVRIQHIPQYGTTGEIDSNKLKEIFEDVAAAARESNANIADARVLLYDTLVLEKGTDYDTKGTHTREFSEGRAQAWTQRALRAGSEATTRRDRARDQIANREKLDDALRRRNKREEQERLDELEAAAAAIQSSDRANDGGVDPPSVAAMQYEDQQQPLRDPHGGRGSLVRSMVNALTGASRDKGGIEIPQSEQEVRGTANLGRGTNPGRKGSAPVWRPLGGTFRKREAELYRKIEGAAELIRRDNPENPENPKDPAKYENSQKLFDYLSGKETSADSELQAAIGELRREIPVIPAENFLSLRYLDSGVESDVHHDTDSGVVYKLYGVYKGSMGKPRQGAYVPGELSLGADKEIRVAMGPSPTLSQFFGRMERANSHGALTPHELSAITPEGWLVFSSPFVEGRGVTQKNLPAALARAGVHLLTEMGGTSGIAQLPDGRWVLYDDLHPGNVRTMPGGRVEIVDANNRELDSYEVADLTTLGKMPPEKPLAPPKAKATKKTQKYDNVIVVAPMVETHHGTPHEWEPEVKVRFADGTEQWFSQSVIDEAGGLKAHQKIVERAPAGRVRKEKVGSGEGNAAFGWGVLYSAQAKTLAEKYRDTLIGDRPGTWFISGTAVKDLRGEEWFALKQGLELAVPHEEYWHEGLKDLRQMAKTEPRYQPMVDALEEHRDQLEYRAPKGNVYTVRLDADDPELLDWFMPMRDQMHVWDKVAARFNVTRESAKEAWLENDRLAEVSENLETYSRQLRDDPEATPGLREEIIKEQSAAEERWNKHYRQADTMLGQVLTRIEKPGSYDAKAFDGEKFYVFLTDLLKGKRAASEYLNLAGVPGIVFLDRMSRRSMTSIWQEPESGAWNVSEPDPTVRSGTKVTSFAFKKQAEDYVAALPKTNNYVMFDPERIKVVAKNGEVVRTVADDMPAPPEPGTEPVTVAAMAEVKDDTDLSVAPMAGRGTHARYPWLRRPEAVAGYKPGGLLTPHAQLSREVGNFVQERERREKATAYRAEAMVKDLERALKTAYGKQGPDKTQNRDIQMALGNLDNRLTPEQYNESLKYTGDARRSFRETALSENVDAARARQQTALARLPDIVRKYVNKLRNKLDLEAKELLKDPGLDTELRARIDSEMGVHLHSDSFQHFESDVWGKHIKSDDPEAQRIRRAAEALFKNEIIAEKAHEYQVTNPGTSDADALAHASALPNIAQMVKNRLAAYLRKNASEATRMHLLTGKMPIHRVPESGKLLSLNRESIPQEVKELWGQWTDPKINFVKTYTLLANHNADIRMQQSIVEDGTRPETGYIWKPDPSNPDSSPSEGLVPLGKAGDDGPLADAYGPQHLKDGLANFHNPAVQDWLVDLNRWSLMMKTVGNVASAVHNFFGNIAFSITNGNLPWAVTMAPKTLISSAFESFVVAAGRATTKGGQITQDKITEMIDLGVFDTDIAINTIKKMARASQAGIAVEKKLGPAAGLQAVMKVLHTGALKTGGAFKETYQAADNWWKYFNYQIELAKQQWIHSGDASVTLDQMKRNAADMVLDTLPSYSRVPELVRRGLGVESVFKHTGAFFTFQTESARTVAKNVTHVGRELVHGKNWKEQLIAGYRTGGMMAMLAMPYLFGSLAKWMFGYDDEDEEALRNSLPEYQKNASLLIMLPKDEKGNPRYVDLSWLNPYGLIHSAGIAASRARREGKGVGAAAGAAGWTAIQPLLTVQPGVGTIMDIVRNQDSLRGGRQIYNPEDTVQNQITAMGLRALQGLAPGTLQNLMKATESALGHVGPSGKEPDPLQDITAGLLGAPRFNTLELDRAMHSHVGKYKKTMGDTMKLLNDVVGTKATVGEGEVAAAYKQANAKAEEHFSNMHKAYQQMIKLKMDEDVAEEAMEIGFGTEIMKGGLSQHKIGDIIDGEWEPIKISKKKAEEAGEYHPERLEEYEKALEEAQRAYDLQNP